MASCGLVIGVDHFCYQGCPACLVSGAQSLSAVSMEVFIKKEVIFEVWILLKLGLFAVNWAIPVFISSK